LNTCKRVALAALAAAIFGGLAGAPTASAATGKGGDTAADAGTSASGDAGAAGSDTASRDFWTPERMAQAIASDDASDTASTATPADTPPPGTPHAKPFDGWAQPGALFVADSPTSTHHCSASVVHSAKGDLIMTAAHCLWSGGHYRRYLAFVPGYHNGVAPYGTWYTYSSGHQLVPAGWRQSQDPAYDYGFVAMAPYRGRNIESYTGGLTLTVHPTLPSHASVVGYASGQGGRPLICNTTVTRSGAPKYFERLDCVGLPGGTSGSPWIAAGTQNLIGLTGGYDRGGDHSTYKNYSVYFDHETRDLFNAAQAI
jgi:V8-like Glu-specific endopeptidase